MRIRNCSGLDHPTSHFFVSIFQLYFYLPLLQFAQMRLGQRFDDPVSLSPPFHLYLKTQIQFTTLLSNRWLHRQWVKLHSENTHEKQEAKDPS